MRHKISLAALLLTGIAALALGALTATGQGAPTTHADLTIRHAAVGCHLWAVNGGSYQATQRLTLREGQSFTVENRDNCSHALVQSNGPSLAMVRNLSSAEGAAIEPFQPGVRVTLVKAGTYRFTTVENEAFKYGWQDELYGGISRAQSRGPDRVLQLVVRVWPDRNHPE